MKMASDNDASCVCDPNFAVICSFLERFAKTCGITHPNIQELQEMLENSQEVPQPLVDLHVKLLRKAKMSVSTERWERALIKFCHTYSNQDGWELERFGYKKARLAVKLRILKMLLELQFDLNTKFKAEINRLSAEELRCKPLGRDKLGQTYWCQEDEDCNLRVYREDLDNETWEVVARDFDGLVQLISQLSSNDPFRKDPEAILNEDSNSLEIKKPITDTGQVTESPEGEAEEEEEIEEEEEEEEDDEEVGEVGLEKNENGLAEKIKVAEEFIMDDKSNSETDVMKLDPKKHEDSRSGVVENGVTERENISNGGEIHAEPDENVLKLKTTLINGNVLNVDTHDLVSNDNVVSKKRDVLKGESGFPTIAKSERELATHTECVKGIISGTTAVTKSLMNNTNTVGSGTLPKEVRVEENATRGILSVEMKGRNDDTKKNSAGSMISCNNRDLTNNHMTKRDIVNDYYGMDLSRPVKSREPTKLGNNESTIIPSLISTTVGSMGMDLSSKNVDAPANLSQHIEMGIQKTKLHDTQLNEIQVCDLSRRATIQDLSTSHKSKSIVPGEFCEANDRMQSNIIQSAATDLSTKRPPSSSLIPNKAISSIHSKIVPIPPTSKFDKTSPLKLGKETFSIVNKRLHEAEISLGAKKICLDEEMSKKSLLKGFANDYSDEEDDEDEEEDEEEEEEEEEEDLDDDDLDEGDDSEVGEAIEEPLMLVRGEGLGKDCDTGNPEKEKERETENTSAETDMKIDSCGDSSSRKNTETVVSMNDAHHNAPQFGNLTVGRNVTSPSKSSIDKPEEQPGDLSDKQHFSNDSESEFNTRESVFLSTNCSSERVKSIVENRTKTDNVESRGCDGLQGNITNIEKGKSDMVGDRSKSAIFPIKESIEPKGLGTEDIIKINHPMEKEGSACSALPDISKDKKNNVETQPQSLCLKDAAEVVSQDLSKSNCGVPTTASISTPEVKKVPQKEEFPAKGLRELHRREDESTVRKILPIKLNRSYQLQQQNHPSKDISCIGSAAVSPVESSLADVSKEVVFPQVDLQCNRQNDEMFEGEKNKLPSKDVSGTQGNKEDHLANASKTHANATHISVSAGSEPDKHVGCKETFTHMTTQSSFKIPTSSEQVRNVQEESCTIGPAGDVNYDKLRHDVTRIDENLTSEAPLPLTKRFLHLSGTDSERTVLECGDGGIPPISSSTVAAKVSPKLWSIETICAPDEKSKDAVKLGTGVPSSAEETSSSIAGPATCNSHDPSEQQTKSQEKSSKRSLGVQIFKKSPGGASSSVKRLSRWDIGKPVADSAKVDEIKNEPLNSQKTAEQIEQSTINIQLPEKIAKAKIAVCVNQVEAVASHCDDAMKRPVAQDGKSAVTVKSVNSKISDTFTASSQTNSSEKELMHNTDVGNTSFTDVLRELPSNPVVPAKPGCLIEGSLSMVKDVMSKTSALPIQNKAAILKNVLPCVLGEDHLANVNKIHPNAALINLSASSEPDKHVGCEEGRPTLGVAAKEMHINKVVGAIQIRQKGSTELSMDCHAKHAVESKAAKDEKVVDPYKTTEEHCMKNMVNETVCVLKGAGVRNEFSFDKMKPVLVALGAVSETNANKPEKEIEEDSGVTRKKLETDFHVASEKDKTKASAKINPHDKEKGELLLKKKTDFIKENIVVDQKMSDNKDSKLNTSKIESTWNAIENTSTGNKMIYKGIENVEVKEAFVQKAENVPLLSGDKLPVKISDVKGNSLSKLLVEETKPVTDSNKSDKNYHQGFFFGPGCLQHSLKSEVKSSSNTVSCEVGGESNSEVNAPVTEKLSILCVDNMSLPQNLCKSSSDNISSLSSKSTSLCNVKETASSSNDASLPAILRTGSIKNQIASLSKDALNNPADNAVGLLKECPIDITNVGHMEKCSTPTKLNFKDKTSHRRKSTEDISPQPLLVSAQKTLGHSGTNKDVSSTVNKISVVGATAPEAELTSLPPNPTRTFHSIEKIMTSTYSPISTDEISKTDGSLSHGVKMPPSIPAIQPPITLLGQHGTTQYGKETSKQQSSIKFPFSGTSDKASNLEKFPDKVLKFPAPGKPFSEAPISGKIMQSPALVKSKLDIFGSKSSTQLATASGKSRRKSVESITMGIMMGKLAAKSSLQDTSSQIKSLDEVMGANLSHLPLVDGPDNHPLITDSKSKQEHSKGGLAMFNKSDMQGIFSLPKKLSSSLESVPERIVDNLNVQENALKFLSDFGKPPIERVSDKKLPTPIDTTLKRLPDIHVDPLMKTCSKPSITDDTLDLCMKSVIDLSTSNKKNDDWLIAKSDKPSKLTTKSIDQYGPVLNLKQSAEGKRLQKDAQPKVPQVESVLLKQEKAPGLNKEILEELSMPEKREADLEVHIKRETSSKIQGQSLKSHVPLCKMLESVAVDSEACVSSQKGDAKEEDVLLIKEKLAEDQANVQSPWEVKESNKLSESSSESNKQENKTLNTKEGALNTKIKKDMAQVCELKSTLLTTSILSPEKPCTKQEESKVVCGETSKDMKLDNESVNNTADATKVYTKFPDNATPSQNKDIVPVIVGDVRISAKVLPAIPIERLDNPKVLISDIQEDGCKHDKTPTRVLLSNSDQVVNPSCGLKALPSGKLNEKPVLVDVPSEASAHCLSITPLEDSSEIQVTPGEGNKETKSSLGIKVIPFEKLSDQTISRKVASEKESCFINECKVSVESGSELRSSINDANKSFSRDTTNDTGPVQQEQLTKKLQAPHSESSDVGTESQGHLQDTDSEVTAGEINKECIDDANHVSTNKLDVCTLREKAMEIGPLSQPQEEETSATNGRLQVKAFAKDILCMSVEEEKLKPDETTSSLDPSSCENESSSPQPISPQTKTADNIQLLSIHHVESSEDTQPIADDPTKVQPLSSLSKLDNLRKVDEDFTEKIEEPSETSVNMELNIQKTLGSDGKQSQRETRSKRTRSLGLPPPSVSPPLPRNRLRGRAATIEKCQSENSESMKPAVKPVQCKERNKKQNGQSTEEMLEAVEESCRKRVRVDTESELGSEDAGGKRRKLRGKRAPDLKLRRTVEEQKRCEASESSSDDDQRVDVPAYEDASTDDSQSIPLAERSLKLSRGRSRGRGRGGRGRGRGRGGKMGAESRTATDSPAPSSDALSETSKPEVVTTPDTTPSKPKGARAKRTPRLLGLDVGVDIILEQTSNGAGSSSAMPIRQSRRIAQIKIREEAERRKLEELTLFQLKEEQRQRKHRSKRDAKDSKSDKRKRRKKGAESDEDYTAEDVDDDANAKKKAQQKKKKRRRKKKSALSFNENNPWQSSSGSSSSEEEEEEEQYQTEEEEEEVELEFKSDHEFSPESDLEDGTGEITPIRRARTAQKELDAEEPADEHACQKCNKSDHPEWILLCDKCDSGWHGSCLRPALLVIPEGDWFCPPCEHTFLLTNLQQYLVEFDRNCKRRENEELRRKRLAYVGISLDNVLASKEKEEPSGESTRDSKRDVSSSESESESEPSSSSGEESEPVYQLRERRQALFSYRFNEYDDLINSAIQDELDAVKGAGNQGRGKDIATIVNAEKEEQEEKSKVTAELHKELIEDQKVGELNDVKEKEEEEDDEEEEEEGYIPPVRKFPVKKKHRRLNSLDISSEDDAESDEDFKGSSSDNEEEEDYEEGEGEESEDSDVIGRRRRGGSRRKKNEPVRRSSRARITRFDKEFINDDSEESEPQRKKTRRLWQDSDSEESDTTWGRPKRRKQFVVHKSKSKKKKKKHSIDSDVETTKTKKPKIKYGGLDDDSPIRRTRGRKINYQEMDGSDTEEEVLKSSRRKLESEDDYVANEEEEEEEEEEEATEDKTTENGKVKDFENYSEEAGPLEAAMSVSDEALTLDMKGRLSKQMKVKPELKGLKAKKPLRLKKRVIRDDSEDEMKQLEEEMEAFAEAEGLTDKFEDSDLKFDECSPKEEEECDTKSIPLDESVPLLDGDSPLLLSTSLKPAIKEKRKFKREIKKEKESKEQSKRGKKKSKPDEFAEDGSMQEFLQDDTDLKNQLNVQDEKATEMRQPKGRIEVVPINVLLGTQPEKASLEAQALQGVSASHPLQDIGTKALKELVVAQSLKEVGGTTGTQVSEAGASTLGIKSMANLQAMAATGGILPTKSGIDPFNAKGMVGTQALKNMMNMQSLKGIMESDNVKNLVAAQTAKLCEGEMGIAGAPVRAGQAGVAQEGMMMTPTKRKGRGRGKATLAAAATAGSSSMDSPLGTKVSDVSGHGNTGSRYPPHFQPHSTGSGVITRMLQSQPVNAAPQSFTAAAAAMGHKYFGSAGNETTPLVGPTGRGANSLPAYSIPPKGRIPSPYRQPPPLTDSPTNSSGLGMGHYVSSPIARGTAVRGPPGNLQQMPLRMRNPTPGSQPPQMYHTAHHPLDPSPSGGGPIVIAPNAGRAGENSSPLHQQPPTSIPPSAGSPLSNKPVTSASHNTPPPPPYTRPGPPPSMGQGQQTSNSIAPSLVQFPMHPSDAPPPPSGPPPGRHGPLPFPPNPSANHLQQAQPSPPPHQGRSPVPGNFSPYHPPPPSNYHYGAYPPPPPLSAADDALPPSAYQGSPYADHYASDATANLQVSDGSNSKPYDEEGGGEFGGLVSYFSSQREDDLDA